MTTHYRQNLPILAQDKDFTSARSAFIRAKKLVKNYSSRLRKIARHIADITKAFEADPIGNASKLESVLRRYAETITPWAQATAERMVTEVAQNDKQAWRKVSAEMGRELQKEIETAPTGALMQQLQNEQVGLIRSLPLESAERVHKLVTEGLSQGRRASEISDEIMKTGEVSRSRADLIARTETSRVATNLTAARAQHIGSTHFMWVTAGDADVRPSHKALNGKVFRWDEPPECDPGHHALPGAIWNCRCLARPIIPD